MTGFRREDSTDPAPLTHTHWDPNIQRGAFAKLKSKPRIRGRSLKNEAIHTESARLASGRLNA